MLSRKRLAKRLAYKTVASNRRKRMLANNKKKIIWRHHAFMLDR